MIMMPHENDDDDIPCRVKARSSEREEAVTVKNSKNHSTQIAGPNRQRKNVNSEKPLKIIWVESTPKKSRKEKQLFIQFNISDSTNVTYFSLGLSSESGFWCTVDRHDDWWYFIGEGKLNYDRKQLATAKNSNEIRLNVLYVQADELELFETARWHSLSKKKWNRTNQFSNAFEVCCMKLAVTAIW